MATASNAVRAQFVRKVSASTDIGKTLRKAVRALSAASIPSLVVGGYAVQEHGYARFTSDVDIVVSSVAAAHARLSISGFRENPGPSMTVTDRITKVEVDLLPGEGAVGPGPLNLPMPTSVDSEPAIAGLGTLIEIKLTSYIGSPIKRLRDLSDVIELIKQMDFLATLRCSLSWSVRTSLPGTVSKRNAFARRAGPFGISISSL